MRNSLWKSCRKRWHTSLLGYSRGTVRGRDLGVPWLEQAWALVFSPQLLRRVLVSLACTFHPDFHDFSPLTPLDIDHSLASLLYQTRSPKVSFRICFVLCAPASMWFQILLFYNWYLQVSEVKTSLWTRFQLSDITLL